MELLEVLLLNYIVLKNIPKNYLKYFFNKKASALIALKYLIFMSLLKNIIKYKVFYTKL